MNARRARNAALLLCVLAPLVITTTSGAAVLSRTTPACSASFVNNSHSVINLTFWESMPKGANGGLGNFGALDSLVQAFNRAYVGKINVTNVNQPGGNATTWTNYTAALAANSGVPNVVMLNQDSAQSAFDTKSILPISTCVAATSYTTAPFNSKVLGAYRVGKTIYGMPFSATVPVMYVNKQALTQAHIAAAPRTMAQLLTDQKTLQHTWWLKSGKRTYYSSGVSLKYDPWMISSWLALDDHSVVNNLNGHAKRATSVTITTANATKYLADLQQIAMSAGGLNVTNPASASYAAANANLFDLTNGVSGITFDTTAALGQFHGFLATHHNATVVGVPLPTLTGHSLGSMPASGNGLFINRSGSSSAQQAASWVFIKFLTAAAQLAKWDKATGYLPIRSDEVARWKASLSIAQRQWYSAGFAELASGKVDPATMGPLVGPSIQVNNDLQSALQSLLSASFSTAPTNALLIATANANADIASYNSVVPALT